MRLSRPLIFAALLVVLLVGLVPVGAGAITASQAQDELSRTRQQLTLMQERIAAARERAGSLGAQIQDIDGRLGRIEGELAETSGQIATVEHRLVVAREKLDRLRAELRANRAALEVAEDKLELQEIAFEQRVVMAYKADDLSYLDVLLQSSTFDELVRSLRVVNDVVSGESDLIGDLEQARAEVATQREALMSKQDAAVQVAADLEEQRAELAALRATQQAQRDAVYATRQEKDATLDAARLDLAQLQREEDRLLQQSQNLSAIINGNSGGGHGTGAMMWPVSGTVTSGFGYRVHPILGRRILHTGIDIAAGSGAPIWAADGGAVIYARWIDGYGNTVAIDHGGGVSTLYAHQSSLAVGYGQTVTKGQVVGYVGSTGLSTGPHLHFEVRVNGSPVDPMGYLP